MLRGRLEEVVRQTADEFKELYKLEVRELKKPIPALIRDTHF